MIRNKKVLLLALLNDAVDDVIVERLSCYFSQTEMRRIMAYNRALNRLHPSVQSYVRECLSAEEQAKEVLSARIILCTLNLVPRFSFYGVPSGHLDVLRVDETGHVIEPEVVTVASTLMDFAGSAQMVLASDPKQLGPIVTSSMCHHFGMSISYMECLIGRSLYGKKDDGAYESAILTKLVQYYRSHPGILRLRNELFYGGDLHCCGDAPTTHNLCKWEHLPVEGFPVDFHSVNGENLREAQSSS